MHKRLLDKEIADSSIDGSPLGVRGFIMLLMFLLFAGCIVSKYPIDDPAAVKIDPRLLGKWETKGFSEDSIIYTITQQDDYRYFVALKHKQEKKPKKYPAFLSDVNNNWFLNIYNNVDSPIGYSFLEILNANAAYDKVTTLTVSDSALKYMNSAAEVRAYLTKNLHNPLSFSDTTHLNKLVGYNLSLYPINDPPKIKIDARLLGKWKAKNKNGGYDIYTIAKKGLYQYLVTVKEDKKKATGKKIAYLSQVNNAWFLNMYCEENGDEGYRFMKFLGADPSYDKVTTVNVADSSFIYLNSSAEVRNLIAKNLNNHSFYGDTLRLYKMK